MTQHNLFATRQRPLSMIELRQPHRKNAINDDFDALECHVRGFGLKHLSWKPLRNNENIIAFKTELLRIMNLATSTIMGNYEQAYWFALQTILLNLYLYDFTIPPTYEEFCEQQGITQ